MKRNPAAMQETWIRFPGWEESLEEVMATHSNILAWRIPTDKGAWHVTSKSQTQLSGEAHTKKSRLYVSVSLLFPTLCPHFPYF